MTIGFVLSVRFRRVRRKPDDIHAPAGCVFLTFRFAVERIIPVPRFRRGKKAPASFQFILHLKPELTEDLLRKEGDSELLSCVGALVLTIRYKDGEATLLSGISMKSFTINKNADILWDKAIRRFLQSKGIAFEPLS